jgi:hypothetical protein
MKPFYFWSLLFLAYSCQKKGTPASLRISIAPTITSITPTTASPNTVVTIRGTNFSADSTADTVEFNGVRAVIRSASDTTLVVLVPTGGTNGPITIVTGTGSVTGPQFTYGPNVYVAGYERWVGDANNIGGAAIAKYWNNGTSINLIGNLDYGFAYGISLTDTDVYVIGYASSTGAFHSYYWTREGYFPLTEGPYDCHAYAMVLVGGQIYAAGTFYPQPDGQQALMWVNGVTDSLTKAPSLGFADAITAAGNDIYVGGYINDTLIATEQHPVYWKNGSIVYLPHNNPYGYITGIAVNGTDVYAAGTDDGGVSYAVQWKNGVPTYLTDGTQGAGAKAIQVVGSDVYVAGYEFNGSFLVAKYWKNGVPVSLTNGQTDAEANAILVVGNDVYVSGYESNTTQHAPDWDPDLGFVAKYWKNGVAVQLGTGVTGSQAYGIAIK